MRDVRIVEKIIIQTCNNLQVLWSSKVIFVSLSQLLGCPLFGSNSGVFTVPGFIVPLVRIKKKKEEERKRRYKGKERRNKTRKKEREEEVVKRKTVIIIIKKQLRKSLLLALKWPSQFCWSFWLQQAEGDLVPQQPLSVHLLRLWV